MSNAPNVSDDSGEVSMLKKNMDLLCNDLDDLRASTTRRSTDGLGKMAMLVSCLAIAGSGFSAGWITGLDRLPGNSAPVVYAPALSMPMTDGKKDWRLPKQGQPPELRHARLAALFGGNDEDEPRARMVEPDDHPQIIVDPERMPTRIVYTRAQKKISIVMVPMNRYRSYADSRRMKGLEAPLGSLCHDSAGVEKFCMSLAPDELEDFNAWDLARYREEADARQHDAIRPSGQARNDRMPSGIAQTALPSDLHAASRPLPPWVPTGTPEDILNRRRAQLGMPAENSPSGASLGVPANAEEVIHRIAAFAGRMDAVLAKAPRDGGAASHAQAQDKDSALAGMQSVPRPLTEDEVIDTVSQRYAPGKAPDVPQRPADNVRTAQKPEEMKAAPATSEVVKAATGKALPIAFIPSDAQKAGVLRADTGTKAPREPAATISWQAFQAIPEGQQDAVLKSVFEKKRIMRAELDALLAKAPGILVKGSKNAGREALIVLTQSGCPACEAVTGLLKQSAQALPFPVILRPMGHESAQNGYFPAMAADEETTKAAEAYGDAAAEFMAANFDHQATPGFVWVMDDIVHVGQLSGMELTSVIGLLTSHKYVSDELAKRAASGMAAGTPAPKPETQAAVPAAKDNKPDSDQTKPH